MWTFPILFPVPSFNFIPSVLQRQDPDFVETFLPKPRAESLDHSDVCKRGWLKFNSISPMTVEICEMDQPTGHWHLERPIGTVQRAAASANSPPPTQSSRVPDFPRKSPRCVSRGLQSSSFGWDGASGRLHS